MNKRFFNFTISKHYLVDNRFNVFHFNFYYIICRRNNDLGLDGGAWNGIVRASVCGIGFTGLALLPNLTHGADGPTRWHLETSGICCLRT